MMTPYDVRARVVECANCGAPLTIIDPSSAKCGYCGTHNQISERPNDGRGPLAPAQEVARLAQLKAQQDRPVPGHVYDLTGLPPSLMFEGATADSVNDLAALHRLWSHAKTVAPDGLEPQRGLCWVAIHSARLFSNSEQHEGARAKLETAPQSPVGPRTPSADSRRVVSTGRSPRRARGGAGVGSQSVIQRLGSWSWIPRCATRRRGSA